MADYNNEMLFTESVSATTATPSVELGTRRVVDGNEYVYCYNGATVADKALIVKPGASCDTGYTFTVTTVVNTMVPCIGMIANATCAAATYCWVMTKGKCKGMVGGGYTYSAGGAVVSARIQASTDGTIDIATGGTGTTGATVGYLTTAISDVTATSVGVYIRTGY